MLRLPNNALQKALIELLAEKLSAMGVAVYDFVPLEAAPPYVTLGTVATQDISTKTEDCYKVSQQINIWSDYKGKHQINNIAEYIINLLTSAEGHLDLKADDFFCNQQRVNMYEAYPEENTGYNGVIEFEAYILNLKESPINH